MNDQEKTRLEALEKAEKKLKDRYKYQNDYIKNKYDRLVIALPKGQKAEIENLAAARGFKSVTDYIKFLIDQDQAPVQESGSNNPVKIKKDQEPKEAAPEPDPDILKFDFFS